jgi:hypothetical protein
MASVSLSITAAQVEVLDPLNITVGTNAPAVGDIEIRVNTANLASLKQIFLALEKFDDFVNDQNLGPVTFGLL